MSVHEFSCPVLERIWGNPDTILLIFAGGAAEFAATKAVDWLFFTNALPADPLGRFFRRCGLPARGCPITVPVNTYNAGILGGAP
jgi:hypothetical protein